MRWIFYLVTTGALAGFAAWLAASPDRATWLPAVASGLVVFLGAVGTVGLRRRREAVTRSAHTDSVERDFAIQTQAKTFIDALVLGVALAACLWMFDLEAHAAALVTLYVVVIVADFWLRYALRLDAVRG
jgi:cytochrome c biogenesis protein CcdA